MEEEVKKLSKHEQDVEDFKDEIFVTVIGRKSIRMLNKEIGLPLAILKFAKINKQ